MHLVKRARKTVRLLQRRRARAQLPAVAAGDVCAPPDFVGIGVQRSGSTWWDDLIASHPGVHRPADRVKEVHYFDSLWHGPRSTPDAPEYARFFPRPPGLLAGEWTPRYLYDPWTLPQLLDAAPAAKLLVILRDPVARYTSALTLQRQWARPANRGAVMQTFARGLYASQLERLFGLVEPDRVLVLQFEQCLRDVDGQLRRTYGFLGLDESFVPPSRHAPRSQAEVPKVQLPADHRRWLVEAYRADVRRTLELVPGLDASLWPTASTA